MSSSAYHSLTVEEINQGREELVSLALAPDTVCQINWYMDLNAALTAANIKAPYQEDEDETGYVNGTQAKSYVYVLTSDGSRSKIDINIDTDFDGSFNAVDFVDATAGQYGSTMAISYISGDTSQTVEFTAAGPTLDPSMSDSVNEAAINESILVLLNKLGNRLSSTYTGATGYGDSSNVRIEFTGAEAGSGLMLYTESKQSSGVGNKLSEQTVECQNFLDKLKAGETGHWYTINENNATAVHSQVKACLAKLFDRLPRENELAGNADVSTAFLDSSKIMESMKDPSHLLRNNFFSVTQLQEVLDSVADRDVHVDGTGADKEFLFESGDSINAIVDVIDTDNKNSTPNKDRWMISLHQTA